MDDADLGADDDGQRQDDGCESGIHALHLKTFRLATQREVAASVEQQMAALSVPLQPAGSYARLGTDLQLTVKQRREVLAHFRRVSQWCSSCNRAPPCQHLPDWEDEPDGLCMTVPLLFDKEDNVVVSAYLISMQTIFKVLLSC